MLAWGSEKARISKNYSNVFYLEDKQSHARIHNEVIKAKQIVIFGGTFDAYQIAATTRDYLDSIGYTDTKIMLMHTEFSDV